MKYTDSIVRFMGMSGEELLRIRKSLGLTQVAIADRIGVKANTVARWEREELQISEPVSRFIRLIAQLEKTTKRQKT